MPKEIRFYSWKKDYFEFSNFSNYGFLAFDDMQNQLYYPTAEHYFQAMKFVDMNYRQKIRTAHFPKEAKRLGASRSYPIRNDWDQVRVPVMRTAIVEKFTQNPSLQDILLNTGDAILIEDSPYDYFWGAGKNNTGKNMLGQLLMELRSYLRGIA